METLNVANSYVKVLFGPAHLLAIYIYIASLTAVGLVANNIPF